MMREERGYVRVVSIIAGALERHRDLPDSAVPFVPILLRAEGRDEEADYLWTVQQAARLQREQAR